MNHSQPLLQTAFGDFLLRCIDHDATAQAWNQADCYLLNQLAKKPELVKQGIATINDQFGALSIATAQFRPEVYNDSAIFKHWLSTNWNQDTKAPECQPINQLSQSQQKTFLLRLPKNLHFFQHQLSLLSQLEDITVLVAGMQKYWPKSFYESAYDYFEIVDVLPGVKKAKCMLLQKGKNNNSPEIQQHLNFPEFNISVINYPNVFSREGLDIGTRFFLENFPDLSKCNNVIDLACGNGILGIKALQLYNTITVNFIDESNYATQSCIESVALNKLPINRYNVIQNNSLYNLELPTADAILCNPPFHQQHTISDQTTKTMILQCHQQLTDGGKLFLIGNRHLQYHIPLKKKFSYVEQLATNAKFILYQATK